MMNVILKSKRYNIDINVNRRVTVIQDNSSSGKTFFIDIIRNIINDSFSTISKPKELSINILNGIYQLSELRAYKDSILFIDEDIILNENKTNILNDNELIKYILNFNIYVIAISRDKNISLPHSPKEVYKIKYSGKYITFEQVYNIEKLNNKKYKNILTEDSKGGLSFIQEALPNNNIISSYGSSKIISKLKDINYNVLVMLDLANYTYKFNLLYKLALDGTIDILNRESFEEQILNMTMFKDVNKNVIDFNDIKYISWESAYEDLLKHSLDELTGEGYNKDNLSNCLIKKCGYKKQKCSNCKLQKISNKYQDFLKKNNLTYLQEEDYKTCLFQI